MHRQFHAEVIETLKTRPLSSQELANLKLRLCTKYGVRKIPSNIEILLHASREDRQKISLITKPVRTASGVAVVTIMTAPIACPHGRCTFCPGGPNSVFGDVPQSYTGNEPASMRAIRAGYDPYVQVFNRLEQYVVTGHSFDKIELIFNGGTFTAMPKDYQDNFVTQALQAMNDFSALFFSNGELNIERFKAFYELPGDFKDANRVRHVQERILAQKGSSTLQAEQQRNETAKVRCIAFCIETKPDWSMEPHINGMLNQGATRVELGVQTLHDDILQKTHRGHTLADTVKATQLLKDSLLKTGYHIMPGLPGATRDKDIAVFRELFANQDYRPDALKIYPTMVMPGTALWAAWKAGTFTPITLKQAAEIITEGKRFIPEYCRIMRVQRDIPTNVTAAGVDRTNLRQYVEQMQKEKGVVCRCIRCREPKDGKTDVTAVKLKTTVYDSSGGQDVFIAAEETRQDKLLGFCRLRIPFMPHRKEFTERTAGIRELHVYGTAANIGEHGSVQHHGIGMQLVREAERIAAEEWNKNRMLIIAGIGVRDYYRRKLGYRQEGPYMAKTLQ